MKTANPDLVKSLLEVPEETQNLEFKRVSSQGNVVHKVCQTVVAFANTEGGTIVLGVADPEQARFKGK